MAVRFQKRLEPLPIDLNSPLPERWDRVILERDILLIDRRTIVYSTSSKT
jgi:hypothetical protein